ncbi:hypothetical protein [Mesorhizobium sp. M0488]|uniref:hypothetical protein n=1 Tax=unclassified Mesorhizobium TaxID=325217 RepID=UPI003336BBC8
MQTLLYAGDPVTVFPGDYIRQPQDYADLKAWRDKVGASVFFLQEVSSPAAINEVFPVTDGWLIASAASLPPMKDWRQGSDMHQAR